MNYPGEKDVTVVEARAPETGAPTHAPWLSILTPAVPSRLRQLEWLCDKIGRQIGNLAVEHLVLLDNKRRTVGEKRDALLRIARGDYVAFVDDDDDISDDYVQEIMNAADKRASEKPDVITFLQKATVNSVTAVIQFKLGNPNEGFAPTQRGGYIKRDAWHICAWRRELAIGSAFPPINYGEDWAFAGPLCAIAETSVHIDKILHFYRHDSKTTEAPPPGSSSFSSHSSSYAGVSLVNDAFHKETGH